MIGLIQRVQQACVRVEGKVVGDIGAGLLLMVCVEPADGAAHAERMLDKTLALRVFGDEHGRMNLSLKQTGGELLVVSQFTLAAQLRGGNRPSFDAAAPYAQGLALYDHLLEYARAQHAAVQAGMYGATMEVALVNDGPVTIPLRC